MYLEDSRIAVSKVSNYLSMNNFLIVAELRNFPDIVVATPGRLIDLMKNMGLELYDYARYLILDEGDAMLDIGFE